MNTLIGRTIKKYKVIELLGQGGMAQVYRAEHLPSGQMTALKVMHPHLVSESDFLQRFYREAKAIAKLKHPNIIKVYDFIAPGEIASPCIVMQLINGPTLQACLLEAARFGDQWSFEAILKLLEPLAEAIDYAHSQGRIHRDIKPNNIILHRLTGVAAPSPNALIDMSYSLVPISSKPVLTDFGMALLVNDTRLTMTGAVAGTPTYISPEQANGERGDAASDIYSFGVVAYEMITGKAPFEADTPLATMLQHMNTVPPSPKTLRPQLNDATEKVMLKALAKTPGDRYPDAKTFIHLLEQAIETGKAPKTVFAHSFITSSQFKTGSLIDGRYKVEAILGQGAFSQVYKVKDQTEDAVFALKVISERNLGLDYLKLEFRALSKLYHPLIAKVVDAGRLKTKQYFLKLAYIEGKSLEACILDGSLSEAKKIELLEDILEALTYMENQGFLHRDLKPSNIIVTAAAAKIIDFNVSKPVTETNKTQVGTPRYMPPEVAHFGWHKSGDLYSAGMIFYELFTGRLPFLDMTSLDAWDIPDPREFAPALPKSVAGALLKAIARDPEQRYPSAAGMLKAVRQARLGAGLQEKVSPHLAPAAPSVKTGGGNGVISLQTLPQLQPLTQRGSGYPLAIGAQAGDDDLALITSAGIESVVSSNLQSKQIIWRSSGALVGGAISADGTKAIVASASNQLFSLELPSGRNLSRPIQLTEAIITLACSRDGQFVAVSLKDRQGLLIKMPAGRIVSRWQWGLPVIAFNPGADNFAYVDQEQMIRLVNTEPVAEITRLDVLKENVGAIVFSNDGQYVVTAGNKLRRRHIPSGFEAASVPGVKGNVSAISYSPFENLLAVANSKEVALWNLDNKRKFAFVRVAGARSLNFVAPATLQIITFRNKILTYNLKQKRLINNPGCPLDSFSCVALSADGETVISGNEGGQIKVWNFQNADSEIEWEQTKEAVWAIAIHPYRPLAAVAGSKTLWYYDLNSGRIIGRRRMTGVEGRLAFSGDGRQLLLQKPGRARIIDPNNLRAKALQFKVDAITFSTGNHVLAAIQKGKLLWIDAASGQQRAAWKAPPAYEVVFNHSGSLLAIGTKEGAVSLWNKAGKRLFALQNIEAPVHDISFATDDLLLAALDQQGNLHFWNAAIASKQAALPAHCGPARIAGFSQDGTRLVTAGLDGLIRWWGVL